MLARFFSGVGLWMKTDLFTLSKILGHSNVTVTESAYLDLTDEDIGKRYQHFSPLSGIMK